MMEVIEGADAIEEFIELVNEETGNDPIWLGHSAVVDTVAEDAATLALMDRVALLEQRLAEPISQMRFIQAVEGALTLRTVTAQMDELRAENAQLQQRVQQLEADAKPQ